MKQDVKLTRLLKSALLLLAFCLSAMTCTGVGTAEAAPQQITMSLAQWNQFKEQTNLLEAKLSLVDEKLKQQKSTSKELLTQLDEAQKQLRLTQEALTNSNRSLANVRESLKRSEDLYKTLTRKMESENRKNRRVKYQRNIYAGCAIFAIAYAVAK
nr:MAG TPA: Peptidoglycan endopeptidase [Caudoviricetes sp.]